MQRTALPGAQRLGDKNAQACVLRADGHLCLRLGSYQEARGHYRQVLQLYRDLDDQVGQARAHGDLSTTFAIEDRYREALDIAIPAHVLGHHAYTRTATR